MPPRLAVVIGSGGLKCAASVGLWRVLAREGIEADLAVGSSGGALYAAWLALGRPLHEAESGTASMWNDLFSLSWRSVIRAALPGVFGYDVSVGLGSDARVMETLERAFGDARFEDTRIPLYIAATDAHTGERVLLSEGRLVDALRASISLPVMLPAWPLNGRWLIDGGLSNPLPIDAAVREGCELILAMGFENACHERVRGLGESIHNVMATSVNHLIRATFAFYTLAHHAEVIPILPEFDRPIGLSDTALLPYIIERGELAAEEQLPYLRRLLSSAVGV
jgi:NTE family protein